MDIHLKDFACAEDGKDFSPAARRALRSLRGVNGAKRLLLSKGLFEFWPEKAEEAFLFPSNNDEGLKRIAFRLDGVSDLEIDGQGAELLFHGEIIPFSVSRSHRISIKGLSIDYKRAFHNEALVVASADGHVDLRIDKDEFPYEASDGKLLFKSETGELSEGGNLLEFDTAKRETAFMAHDQWKRNLLSRSEELPDGTVRLHVKLSGPSPKPGNTLVFGCGHRRVPAIFCESSSSISISDASIRHSGGMGVIAQRCDGMRLTRLSVTPPPSGKRIVSATADATHFVNCKGSIELEGCLFENQLDDPANVHGIYAKIVAKPSSSELELKLMHRQQAGVAFIDAGDVAEIVGSQSLLSYHEGKVRDARMINKEIMSICFEKPLPESVKIGDALGNVSWSADLSIKGCVTRGNRARGFLVSTPGNVLIEGNVFHNAGAAILIEGDANYWYEAGAVRNVLIRRNRFENCNYGVWGVATIQVTPGVSKEIKEHVPYHRNIAVKGNVFVSFFRKLLYARDVAGIAFEDNQIEASSAYPCLDGAAPSIELHACSGVSISGNKTAGELPISIDNAPAGTL